MSTWASRISELRKKPEPGLTLAEIGERIGLSPSAVSDIEQERTSEPRGAAALALDSLHRELCGNRTVPSESTTRKTA